ncbi:hypothetical protein SETIT_5G236500v2 [Setaria italica]|uniref:Uncharacterized protein n=1 Tax=Setaria italica TaxID=4555 RepID=A0A368R7Z1_SETIT|nr:hypothetical protein SETIT_5G236500v2 [Setaria italica]
MPLPRRNMRCLPRPIDQDQLRTAIDGATAGALGAGGSRSISVLLGYSVDGSWIMDGGTHELKHHPQAPVVGAVPSVHRHNCKRACAYAPGVAAKEDKKRPKCSPGFGDSVPLFGVGFQNSGHWCTCYSRLLDGK